MFTYVTGLLTLQPNGPERSTHSSGERGCNKVKRKRQMFPFHAQFLIPQGTGTECFAKAWGVQTLQNRSFQYFQWNSSRISAAFYKTLPQNAIKCSYDSNHSSTDHDDRQFYQQIIDKIYLLSWQQRSLILFFSDPFLKRNLSRGPLQLWPHKTKKRENTRGIWKVGKHTIK